MTFCVYLNNQSVRQATLLPNGQESSVTRYIFIQGRDLPIILTDERSSRPDGRAVCVNDGRNPRYELSYEREGKVEVVINQREGQENLLYHARTEQSSGKELPL